jgi:hypothetical protein
VAVPARRARQLPPSRPRPRLAPVPTHRSAARRLRKPRRAAFLLFSLLVVAGLVMALASGQALVAQGSFRLTALSDQVERLEVEVDLLRLRAARMASPNRVAAAARKAGLREPRRVEVLAEPAP